jgi:hypothetical protein
MKKTTMILCLIVTLALALLSGCTFQHGTTRDIVQGWDRGIIWSHMYLKNDHNTAYCFDQDSFNVIFDEAQKTQKEVIVTYETYLVRGTFCLAAEGYEKVIVTGVKFA